MLIEKIKNARLNGNQPAILVIGDLMIDHYLHGKANRLSPEAPVP
jgi:D-beta-D-heptose 7-phosphate kinase/D-beta-D-heptose 1-phosphate adenosyltransferase